MYYFNSIKVRLEPAMSVKKALRKDHFNSIKVRLELDFAPTDNIIVSNFNSIKVRLEHLLRSLSNTSFLFQFHKGTIRTHEREAKYNKFANFNSIKVRLELKCYQQVCFCTLFQFHKGTIRTAATRCLCSLTLTISIP